MKLPKKQKKVSKTSLKKLTKEADKLYQVVYIKLYPRSIVSGKPTEVIHHYIPKSQSNNLRYDFKNAVPITHAEHARHHLSGDPAIVARILEARGQEWNEDLQKKKKNNLQTKQGLFRKYHKRIINQSMNKNKTIKIRIGLEIEKYAEEEAQRIIMGKLYEADELLKLKFEQLARKYAVIIKEAILDKYELVEKTKV